MRIALFLLALLLAPFQLAAAASKSVSVQSSRISAMPVRWVEIVGTALAAPYARAANVGVGQPAPNFRVRMPGEKTLELRELRGQRVLIFFWATW